MLVELIHDPSEAALIHLLAGDAELRVNMYASSAHTVAAALLHAAVTGQGKQTSFALPALSPRFDDLEVALRQRFPKAPRVNYEPDPEIMRGFGRFGDLTSAEAMRLGYPADHDLGELIARAI